jgi:phenylalanyl-tRNA synthetase beta chain
MEYSLYYLNKHANLKNLKVNEIIDKLNLIGFEVDDIFEEQVITNHLLNDTRLLIEIPSNRQDLLNEKLFLQELSTIFSLETYDLWRNLRTNYDPLINKYSLKYTEQAITNINSSLNDILIYKFKLENCFIKSTPLWIQQKLQNRGLEVTNNINDFLNLIVLEYGSTITTEIVNNDNHEIFVTRLEKVEQFENISLPPGTIILRDNQDNILSVLGYINFDSEKNSKDGTVYLETIFYDIYENPVKLKTINTKLSFKHLRSTFIENFKSSLKRLLTLLELYNENLVLQKIYTNSSYDKNIQLNKTIRLSKDLISQVLNTKKFDFDVFKKAGLRIIGETKENFYIQVANFRKDLVREIDLIEEYSRFIGYKNFQEIAPKKQLKYNLRKLENYKFIKEFFINYGFNEVFTNSLLSLNEKTSSFSINLKNPLNKEINALRTSMFPRLFEVMDLNLKSGFNNCSFFEIGRVFKISGDKIIEQDKLSGIFQFKILNDKQENLNWFKVKGFLEIFLNVFGYDDFEVSTIEQKTTYFHPTRSIHFKINNKVLGSFGEINPMIEDFRIIKTPIYLFEFNLAYFKNWRMRRSIKTYTEYSKYPSITRDLSITFDKKISFSKVKELIQKTTKYLKSVNFFDIYFDQSNLEKVNLGIRLEFQNQTRTLTATEIDEEIKILERELINSFQIDVRN